LAYAGNKNYRFPHCSIDFYTAKTLEAASASFYSRTSSAHSSGTAGMYGHKPAQDWRKYS